MTTYSRLDPAGHDAGRIHDLARWLDDGRIETVCGLRIGQYGLAEHVISPTCSACKRARKGR
jgi:hypothetical protein